MKRLLFVLCLLTVVVGCKKEDTVTTKSTSCDLTYELTVDIAPAYDSIVRIVYLDENSNAHIEYLLAGETYWSKDITAVNATTYYSLEAFSTQIDDPGASNYNPELIIKIKDGSTTLEEDIEPNFCVQVVGGSSACGWYETPSVNYHCQ